MNRTSVDAVSDCYAALPHLTGKIYLASSVSTFHTARYDHMLKTAGECFRHATIIPARGLYSGSTDWLVRWPNILSTITGIAFFTDEAGWVGKGVFTELCDADDARLPVVLITDAGGAHLPDAFIVDRVDNANWRRYAHITLATAGTR